MGIALETMVSIEFNDFCKSQCSFELFVSSAGRVDGLVGAFGDGRQKPVDLFLFSRRFGRIIVSHEATNFLEPINVTGDVDAMDVAEVVNKGAKRFLELLF